MAKIKFGTDGWRAIISDDFTFENVKVVSQAIADFIKSHREPVYKKKKVAIGFDTRFLSDRYAKTVASVLAANGVKSVLCDKPCPTPALSLYIKDKKLTGGIMITASHNPPEYNGIKYKGYFGGSAGSDIIKGIEKRLHKKPVKSMSFEKAVKEKKILYDDFIKLQLDHVKNYADMKMLKNAKLKVLVDSMNGTGGTYLEQLLKNTSIKLDFMNTEINPGFKGRAPEPNEKHLKKLMRRVKKGKYDLGIATDGDADRAGILDSNGNMLSGHKVMALLLLHLVENKKMTGGVVQTICGTVLIDKICREFGLDAYKTPVGFKYIAELMTKKKILIGGEETGGIGFINHIPERDAFLTSLLVMEAMVAYKKPLKNIIDDLNKRYGTYVYEREDFVFKESKRKKLMQGMKKKPLGKILNKKVVGIDDSDGTKFICDDDSWLLLRLSGTEPKLRIYSETKSKKASLRYVEYGKKYAFGLM
ncbi:MAG: phosphoglucomutase/phosphomannomutase family protein [Candidatus Omnitrophota bacterium]